MVVELIELRFTHGLRRVSLRVDALCRGLDGHDLRGAEVFRRIRRSGNGNRQAAEKLALLEDGGSALVDLSLAKTVNSRLIVAIRLASASTPRLRSAVNVFTSF